MYYTDYDFEMMAIYNKYIEDVVTESDLPKYIKKIILEERTILKDKQIYFLQKGKYRIDFLNYKQWLLQTERNKKIEQLLNEI